MKEKSIISNGCAIIGLLFSLFLVACQANYAFHEDVVDFVSAGLDIVRLKDFSVTADPLGVNLTALQKAAPGMANDIHLNISNPRNFTVDYTFTYNDTTTDPTDFANSLYDVKPVFDPLTATISCSPKVTTNATDLVFHLSIYVPSIKRTYPDIKLTIPCAYPDSTVTIGVSISGSAANALIFNPDTTTVEQGDTLVIFENSPTLTSGTNWKWYVDGAIQSGQTTSTFTYSASTLGDHTISATVELAGTLYSGDMSFTVKTPTVFSVWYDCNGGTPLIPTVTHNAGDLIVVEDAPARSGYSFLGWQADSAIDSTLTFQPAGSFTMPARNVKMTALWYVDTANATNLAATTGIGMVSLSWTDPASPAYTGVEISWTPTGGNPSQPLFIAPGVKHAAIHGLNDNTTYTFQVHTVFQGGDYLNQTITVTPHDSEAYQTMIKVPIATATFMQGDAFNHAMDPFSIGRYEVSYELWYKVAYWGFLNGNIFAHFGMEGSDGQTASGSPLAPAGTNEPVTYISWRDVIVWCNARSEMEGLTPVYYQDSGFSVPVKDATLSSTDTPYVKWDADGYRLPTEGEWEYAARYRDGSAWTASGYASGASGPTGNAAATGSVAVYSSNAAKTANVGSKEANQLGLYDMSGNVSEWVWDTYNATLPTTDQINYRPGGSVNRLYRGGAWTTNATTLGVTTRPSPTTSSQPGLFLGFRVARSGWHDGTTPALNRFAYLAGADSLKTFKVTPGTGALTDTGFTVLYPANLHDAIIRINPQGSRLYVGCSSSVGGVNGSIYVYDINPRTGALTNTQIPVMSLSDSGYITDMIISPDGSQLYCCAGPNIYSLGINPMNGMLMSQTHSFMSTDIGSLAFGNTHIILTTAGEIAWGVLDANGNITGTASSIGTLSVPSSLIRKGNTLYQLFNESTSGNLLYTKTIAANDTPSLGTAIQANAYSLSMAVNPAGTALYTLGDAGNTLQYYAIGSGNSLASALPVSIGFWSPGSQYRLGVDPDGLFVYACNASETTVAVSPLDSDGVPTGFAASTVPAVLGPYSIQIARFAKP